MTYLKKYMLLISLLLLVFTHSSNSTLAQAPSVYEQAKATDSNKTLSVPDDIKNMATRLEECSHWGGEDPYDLARAEEIRAQVTRLKCDQLEKDESALKTKYQTQPALLKLLEHIHQRLNMP